MTAQKKCETLEGCVWLSCPFRKGNVLHRLMNANVEVVRR
jgi:hypothetical protein